MRRSIIAMVGLFMMFGRDATAADAMQKQIAARVNAQARKLGLKPVAASGIKTYFLNGGRGFFSVETRSALGAFPERVTGSIEKTGRGVKVSDIKAAGDGQPGRYY